MKPFYFPINFGDALNSWMWPRLIPGIFEGGEDHLFIGIGSVLNTDWLPRLPVKRVVFGSGFAYGTCPRIDENWKVYCVRGRKTAKVLGLDPALAITDPALLVATMCARPAVSSRTISFMPHEASGKGTRFEELINWRELFPQQHVRYINVHSPVEQVLSEISSSALLVTEALHGAVVADALRIPWIPVRFYAHVNTFKWEDWCESIGVRYKPHSLPFLDVGVRRDDEPVGQPLYSQARARAALVVRLVDIVSRSCEPMLSSEATHRRLLDLLHGKVAELRRDFFS